MPRYDRMPKRALLKTVHSAWKELGRPVQRGRRFPLSRSGKQASATILDMASNIQSGDVDVTDLVEALNGLGKEGFGCKVTT
jgi:hypothetical protein